LHANESRCRPRGTPHFSCAMSACHDRTFDNTGDIEHLQDTHSSVHLNARVELVNGGVRADVHPSGPT
jgi:hypothetical protein